MEQIFPAVPRNSVRQRLVHLRDVPGTETYLARLEDKWYDLWVQHRGTDELPDPDPASATNFNLAAHVKFLRKHIDKNAMCVSSHLLRCFDEMISVWGGMHAYVADYTFSQTRWLRRDTRQSNGGPAGLHRGHRAVLRCLGEGAQCAAIRLHVDRRRRRSPREAIRTLRLHRRSRGHASRRIVRLRLPASG